MNDEDFIGDMNDDEDDDEVMDHDHIIETEANAELAATVNAVGSAEPAAELAGAQGLVRTLLHCFQLPGECGPAKNWLNQYKFSEFHN